MSEIEFPAAVVVHTPSGPTNACIEHAEKIVSLFRFMGAHVNCTPIDGSVNCDNCMNESRKGTKNEK